MAAEASASVPRTRTCTRNHLGRPLLSSLNGHTSAQPFAFHAFAQFVGTVFALVRHSLKDEVVFGLVRRSGFRFGRRSGHGLSGWVRRLRFGPVGSRIGRGLRLLEIRHERQFLRLRRSLSLLSERPALQAAATSAPARAFSFRDYCPLPTMTPKAKIHPMAMIVMIPLVMRPEKLKLIVYFRLDNFFSPPASPAPRMSATKSDWKMASETCSILLSEWRLK